MDLQGTIIRLALMKRFRQYQSFETCDDAAEVLDYSSQSEQRLAAIAVALGAREVPGWSLPEEQLARNPLPVSSSIVRKIEDRITSGEDPLGESFCVLRPPAVRRPYGATFTPLPIVHSMLDWAESQGRPARIVDPGTGSGRFAVHAGLRFPEAAILGIERDPLPALIARANLATLGLADRSEVVLGDYRDTYLPAVGGKTLFIGNPPYVRHHLLETKWKQWLTRESAKIGLPASQLAGLHVYFFLATALKAANGDYGAFITSAEWLDVNYGKLVRALFLGGLGGRQITVIEPTALPFPDAATTAAVTMFEVGSRSRSVIMRRVETTAEMANDVPGREIHRERLEMEGRWTHLTRPVKKGPSGYVELGELCRVHRGQVTGANRIWIAGPHSRGLPESVLYPSVTRAKELFMCMGRVLKDASILKRVIDLPVDLNVFCRGERGAIEKFLKLAKQLGAHQSYVASNRKAWWSVGLRRPAPILATYMARRPPAFVLNTAEARHLNIAHGLYPREHLDEVIMTRLVDYLSSAVGLADGRTYAGGLTKFEPREMERLLVPGLELLREAAQ